MTVRVYRSTDVGAPALSGADAKLLDVLKACLVNGYGSGGGAKAPLGWTMPYEVAGSRAVFRNNPSLGSGQHIWVRDDITTNKRWARIYGAKTAAAIDTLGGIFPSQVTLNAIQAGCCISKSATTDATVREWVLVGDEITFILLVKTGEVANEWCGTYAGDIASITGSRIFALMARYAQSWTTALTSAVTSPMSATAPALSAEEFGMQHTSSNGFVNQNGFSAFHVSEHPSNAQQSPAGILLSEDAGSTNVQTRCGAQGSSYPAVGGGILLTKNQMVLTSGAVCHIGTMRGVWCPLHLRPLANNDTFSGSGDYAGKTFEAFHLAAGGQLIIETSDTW